MCPPPTTLFHFHCSHGGGELLPQADCNSGCKMLLAGAVTCHNVAVDIESPSLHLPTIGGSRSEGLQEDPQGQSGGLVLWDMLRHQVRVTCGATPGRHKMSCLSEEIGLKASLTLSSPQPTYKWDERQHHADTGWR